MVAQFFDIEGVYIDCCFLLIVVIENLVSPLGSLISIRPTLLNSRKIFLADLLTSFFWAIYSIAGGHKLSQCAAKKVRGSRFLPPRTY
ncbi:MAG: hypothetical protein ACYC4E_00245 [Carboxydocellales bacterium]